MYSILCQKGIFLHLWLFALVAICPCGYLHLWLFALVAICPCGLVVKHQSCNVYNTIVKLKILGSIPSKGSNFFTIYN